jgi:hypothetical protein
MFIFFLILWLTTFASVYIIFNLIFGELRFNYKLGLLFLIPIIGWTYWHIPSKLNLNDISETNIFILSENNYKLDASGKEEFYQLMRETELYKIYSRVGLASLGDKEDTVISIDSPDENFHIYLQEEIENYSYIHYKKRYYQLSNEKEYYKFINEYLESHNKAK